MMISVLVCRGDVKDVTHITVSGANITVVYAVDVRIKLVVSNTVITCNENVEIKFCVGVVVVVILCGYQL
jgi:hypothetical protein